MDLIIWLQCNNINIHFIWLFVLQRFFQKLIVFKINNEICICMYITNDNNIYIEIIKNIRVTCFIYIKNYFATIHCIKSYILIIIVFFYEDILLYFHICKSVSIFQFTLYYLKYIRICIYISYIMLTRFF